VSQLRQERGRLPRVAIVGRPNVGKSTLFNRIVGGRRAIVGSQAGMTRDRHLAEADWVGRRFAVVDTGGMELGPDAPIPQQVEAQVRMALESADLVLFVVDGRDGLVGLEEELAELIRRRGVPVLMVINKCDTREIGQGARLDFAPLGLAPAFDVSAEIGRGVGELLDEVVERLAGTGDLREERPRYAARIAVVGRPNVGKSSLANALLGRPRVIVSDVPGTTRDAIDTVLQKGAKRYLLVDTAGIRKKARLATHAEIASVAVARRRLSRADVALLLIDPLEGVTRQDLHVAQEAAELGCGLVLVVNKWDTVEPEPDLQQRMASYVHQRLGRMSWAPVVFISATEAWGIEAILPLVDEVVLARGRRIPTGALNQAFEEMLQQRPPPGGVARARPKYLTQVGVEPPAFVAFLRGEGKWRTDYRRYLENRLRQAFDFTGTPIVIKVRHKGRGRVAARR